jgi:hypothetical protein
MGPRPDRKTGKTIKCIICDKEFYIKKYRIIDNPRFCSLLCKGKYFRKKRMSKKSEFKEGEHRSLKTEFKKGQTVGEKNINWKGGISKTRDYILFYKRKRKLLQKKVPGNHTLKEWLDLKSKYNFTCPCCHLSEPEIKLTEDHIIPITKDGNNNIENIQPLCGSCNSKKNVKIIKY